MKKIKTVTFSPKAQKALIKLMKNTKKKEVKVKERRMYDLKTTGRRRQKIKRVDSMEELRALIK